MSRLGPHGVKSRWGLATGLASKMITSRSASSSFGLIAIARSPRTRALRIFAPGFLEELWRLTVAPLLIVNPIQVSLNGTTPHSPESLIFPYDVGATTSAIPLASAIAGASRSTVTVVVSASKTNPEIENELLSAFEADSITVDIDRAEEHLAEHVHALQAEREGSWIIAGSKMRSGISRSILGSTADKLARDATGPIIVVPDGRVKTQRLKAAKSSTREMVESL